MFIDVSDLHSLKAEFPIVVTPSAIHQLIRMDYENMHLFRLSRVDRNQIANLILRYYRIHTLYLQPIITQYFIDNKSEIWLLFLIAHSKR